MTFLEMRSRKMMKLRAFYTPCRRRKFFRGEWTIGRHAFAICPVLGIIAVRNARANDGGQA